MMRPCLLFIVSVLATAHPAQSSPQEIQRLDPAVDQLVPANAALEKVATGFNKWTEGPVWTRQGTLLFAEIPANNIDPVDSGAGCKRLHAPQRLQRRGAVQGTGAGFEWNDARRRRPRHRRRARRTHRLAAGVSRSHGRKSRCWRTRTRARSSTVRTISCTNPMARCTLPIRPTACPHRVTPIR